MTTSFILVTLLVAQTRANEPPKNPPPLSAAAFDEDDVAGHPDGEPLPLAKGIDWSLEKAQTAATPRRRRLSLAGPWRFAATRAREVSPKRSEMGYLTMPAVPPAQWEISNGKGKKSPGQWAGK